MTDKEDKSLEEASPTEEPAPNAVLVLRQIDEQGNISCDAIPLGDVQATEVETILKLGVKSWLQKIGLA